MKQNVIKLLKTLNQLMCRIHRVVHVLGLSAFLAPLSHTLCAETSEASANGLMNNLQDNKLKEKALFRFEKNVHRLEKNDHEKIDEKYLVWITLKN